MKKIDKSTKTIALIIIAFIYTAFVVGYSTYVSAGSPKIVNMYIDEDGVESKKDYDGDKIILLSRGTVEGQGTETVTVTSKDGYIKNLSYEFVFAVTEDNQELLESDISHAKEQVAYDNADITEMDGGNKKILNANVDVGSIGVDALQESGFLCSSFSSKGNQLNTKEFIEYNKLVGYTEKSK